MRLCQWCRDDIPDTMRHGTKFCRPAHRVAYFQSQPKRSTGDINVRLGPIEAGLLIDAAVPWFPNLARRTRMSALYNHERTLGRKRGGADWSEARRLDHEAACKALKARKATRRLVALGLARGGMSGRRMVIERTEHGAALAARRHNELHAIAEHVGEAAPDFVRWEPKRATRSLSPLPWPQIDGRLLQLIPDVYQLTVFRRLFTCGHLGRVLPKERQYDVAKACLDWHRQNMVALTKVSIRKWLAAELDKLLHAENQP